METFSQHTAFGVAIRVSDMNANMTFSGKNKIIATKVFEMMIFMKKPRECLSSFVSQLYCAASPVGYLFSESIPIIWQLDMEISCPVPVTTIQSSRISDLTIRIRMSFHLIHKDCVILTLYRPFINQGTVRGNHAYIKNEIHSP